MQNFLVVKQIFLL